MDRLNPCNNMDRLKISMGKITTLICLLICGVYLRRKLPKVHIYFLHSHYLPLTLHLWSLFNSLKQFVTTTENGHDKINGNLSGFVHSIWVTWKTMFGLHGKILNSCMTAHQKKTTMTFPIFTQPAQKYCSYNHLIPFTLHSGQMVDSLSGQKIQSFDFRSDEGGHACVH